MTRAEHEDMRDLAGLVAESVRRMGAAYGSSEDWRRAITLAVKIEERAHLRASGATPDGEGK